MAYEIEQYSKENESIANSAMQQEFLDSRAVSAIGPGACIIGLPGDGRRLPKPLPEIETLPELKPVERTPTTGLVGRIEDGLIGVFETNTGDKLIFNKGGEEILHTTAGASFTYRTDGSVSGDISKVTPLSNGESRVQLKDGTEVLLDKCGIARVEHSLPQDKDGVYAMTTGDKLIVGEDQTLITSDGTKVSVQPDGSVRVNQHLVPMDNTSKLVLDDGTSIEIQAGKIVAVSRDGIEAKACTGIRLALFRSPWFDDIDGSVGHILHDDLFPREKKAQSSPGSDLEIGPSNVLLPAPKDDQPVRFRCVTAPCFPEDRKRFEQLERDRKLP